MQSVAPYSATTRRGLILHDALAFFALLAVSLTLFGVTLFLFKSFQQHRIDLGARWAERGKTSLQAGRAEDAVYALRTALSFTPDVRADQMLLAQALARAGHTDEATSYFNNLWDASPGDGFINLQLARLARQRSDTREADNHYRASIYGSWDGDGVLRRREVRLELADFLIQQHRNEEARNELFTVAGNAPENIDLNLAVASKLEAAGYLPDALSFAEKAAASPRSDEEAMEETGRLAYKLADYPTAEREFERGLDQPDLPEERRRQLEELLGSARRIQQLTLTRDQPAHQRALHIATVEPIVEARLRACIATPAMVQNASLAGVLAQWTALQSGPGGRHKSLIENAADQDEWTSLIYQTERETARFCGPPTGDDALLLLLAQNAQGGAAHGI